ncbi:hypothetical protein Nepgr_030268 [Nepenthes gracilis]|uniref:Uncharacterized protein n=1 Tax=Nepenthes gracilis TaxID=150966 RepID=A0AAD3Y5M6_NEPGR|nr:hypothetical protein Nepgr_030268 [Nepenthes gracilis]
MKDEFGVSTAVLAVMKNWKEGSESGQERNDEVGTSWKPQKHGQGNLQSRTNRGSCRHLRDVSLSKTADQVMVSCPC